MRHLQFQETAKELRDAHTEFGGRLAAKNAQEEEVRFAFPADLDGNEAEKAENGTKDEVVSTVGSTMALPAPSEPSENDSGGASTSVAKTSSQSYQNVSDRLAALKEKLQRQKSLPTARGRAEHGVGETGDAEAQRGAPEVVHGAPPVTDSESVALVAVDGLPIREQATNDTGKEARVEACEHIPGRNTDAEANARERDRYAAMIEELGRLRTTNARLVVGEREAREEAMRAAEEVRMAREEAIAAKEEAKRAREDAAVAQQKLVEGQVSSQQVEPSQSTGQAAETDQSKEIQSLKDQLDKLKMQMLSTQTAFEEQIEAEVQERVSALAAEMSTSSKGRHEEDDQLLADLEIALDKIQEAEKESALWKSEAERMRGELSNMQIALDELRYESENGEKLRVQVRTAQAELREMEVRLSEAVASKEASETKAREAVQRADDERRRAFVAREAEGVAKQDLIALQMAYNDMSNKMRDAEGGQGVIKRELVVQVLKDMAAMRHGKAMKHGVERLGLSDAERQTVLGDNSGLASSFVAFLETSVED